jgi:uncharacterized protein YidB (DUF937 family)
MGLLDSVMSAVGGNANANSGQAASLLPALIAEINNYPGGLQGLIQKFQEGGLGDVVSSWVGTGANQPVSGDQVQSVLGDDVVNNLAQSTNQDKDAVLASLSSLLPHVVDQATPDGTAQDGQSLDASSLMGAVSGLLGKL